MWLVEARGVTECGPYRSMKWSSILCKVLTEELVNTHNLRICLRAFVVNLSFSLVFSPELFPYRSEWRLTGFWQFPHLFLYALHHVIDSPENRPWGQLRHHRDAGPVLCLWRGGQGRERLHREKRSKTDVPPTGLKNTSAFRDCDGLLRPVNRD